MSRYVRRETARLGQLDLPLVLRGDHWGPPPASIQPVEHADDALEAPVAKARAEVLSGPVS